MAVLLDTLSALEENDHLHLARLLLLLRSFAGRDGRGTIDGLTKLAKLDFLLRYPTYLERALVAKGVAPTAAEVKDYERRSVESTMVRYRYGPWDFRYRRFVNLLVAKGLASVAFEGRTIRIGLTETGLSHAARLSEQQSFQDLVSRSHLLRSHFDISATHLKNFVYETFPEIVTLQWGEEIHP